ncbi:MAG: SLC45 family MFS transporter [Ruminococcaceae bacterium]|nr:SLC45 family MFS transporter [Oscillospiraceae bacterium]
MKLNYKKTIFVGFAFFLICTFWQAYDTLIPKILTDKFGMPQTVSGIIMALDNILALFLLPFFGALSDRHRGKRGKRTPFIVIGTLVAAILLVSLSFADNAQLKNVEAVSKVDDPAALSTLYEESDELDVRFNESKEIDKKGKSIKELFTEEEFTAIRSDDKTGNYNAYVVPLRQAYAARATAASPAPLIFFAVILLLTLVAMGTFRSPAVALMPDVTPRPLRSKANAIINLMGAVGGILVLGLGIVFGTGKPQNALMSYTTFFGIVAAIMVVCLMIFLWRVKEPKLVAEMQEESRLFGIREEEPDEKESEGGKLPREKLFSLLLILASVVLWFMGYNAVTSKYSVYAGSVLNLDYNATLIIAQAAAIISYVPIGFISSRFGRKKTILAGILMLGTAFFAASFMRAGSSPLVMNILFALAGIGWATISVNSYPMVVELASGGNVGKYTGFYYTASMAAQTATPVLSGLLMDTVSMTALFPYATIFLALAFVTMFFVKHGESKKAA